MFNVDLISAKEEEGNALKEDAFKKMVVLTELLTFFKDHYSYVDIHSPEIDRREVRFLTKKLKKLGVLCKFYS